MELLESLGKKRVKLREKGTSSQLLAQFVATACGIGYLPLAPGTWASALTATLWFVLHLFFPFVGVGIHIGVVMLLFPLTWWASDVTSKLLAEEDPSIIVIDEIFGQSLALLFLTADWKLYTAGFLLFRFFDVVKPFPIRHCEKFRGGLGILMDDLAAGIYPLIFLWLFLYAS